MCAVDIIMFYNLKEINYLLQYLNEISTRFVIWEKNLKFYRYQKFSRLLYIELYVIIYRINFDEILILCSRNILKQNYKISDNILSDFHRFKNISVMYLLLKNHQKISRVY